MDLDLSKAKIIEDTQSRTSFVRYFILNNEKYLIKAPKAFNKNIKNFADDSIRPETEYIGSHIFNLAGVKAQETWLTSYSFDFSNFAKLIGIVKYPKVVICKSIGRNIPVSVFWNNYKKVHKITDDNENDLTAILALMSEVFGEGNVQFNFWNCFVIDALIGNKDRCSENIAFNRNANGILQFTKVYDCAESFDLVCVKDKNLSDLRDLADGSIKKVSSSFRINGERINYHDYITGCTNPDCNAAVLRMVPQINMDKINQMIDDAPSLISDERKEYYKYFLKVRKEQILDQAYLKLIGKEK